MSSLPLIILGLALLFMGHRFLGRYLESAVFKLPADNITLPTTAGLAHLGGAGAIIPIIGISLALTWGWVPAYILVLSVGALIAVYLQSGTAWLLRQSPGTGSGLPLEAISGRFVSSLVRSALLVVLILLQPVLALLFASLILAWPGIIVLLGVHALLAAVVGRVDGKMSLLATFAAILVSTMLLAGIALGLNDAINFDLTSDSAMMKTTAALIPVISITIVSTRIKTRYFALPFTAINNLLLLLAGFILFIIIGLENPEPGYQPYFNSDQGNTLPLLFGCIGLGVMSLLPFLGERKIESQHRRVAAPAIEAFLALAVLLVLLGMPSLFPDKPIQLPDWNLALAPGETFIYIVESVARMGQLLPVSSEALHLFVGYVFASACLTLLMNLNRALRSHTSAVFSEELRLNNRLLLVPTVLSLILTAVFGYNAIPVNYWLIVCAILLLIASALFAHISVAQARYQHGSALSLVFTLVLFGLFWWLIVDIGIISAGQSAFLVWMLPIAILAVVGGLIHWHLTAEFLSIQRQRFQQTPVESRE